MSFMGSQQYKQMGAYGNLADASPHRVVQVMLDTLLSRVAEATGHLERDEIQQKGEKIGKALGIVEALMLGLDKSQGGEVAANLERLYEYVSRTLLKANLENNGDLLREVSGLLREIKLGWDGIDPAGRA